MAEYNFSGKNGECPNCTAFEKIWYIQDRYIGGGKYEYCLMSRPVKKPDTHIFKSKNEVAAWLNESPDAKIDDSTADYIIARDAIRARSTENKKLFLHKGKEWIYDKSKNSVTEMVKRDSETGWFDEYRECLKMAKKILNEKQGQMSLFDF